LCWFFNFDNRFHNSALGVALTFATDPYFLAASADLPYNIDKLTEVKKLIGCEYADELKYKTLKRHKLLIGLMLTDTDAKVLVVIDRMKDVESVFPFIQIADILAGVRNS
jgi:hypothetical protein